LAGRPDVIAVTIFAGTPKAKGVATTYDVKTGFKNADEAMTARRDEDKMAMALLGATPVHLGFVDGQYGKPASREGIAKCIQLLIEEHDPEFVVGPLGLLHSDHELVRDALLDATTDLTVPVWLYEDLPARVVEPGSVSDALQAVLDSDGVVDLESGFVGTGPLDRKMSALWMYRSQMQLPEFQNLHVLLVPERFWRVVKEIRPEKES
jgi:LmbE family N-acetylglucosaminyl deacetylase